MKLAIVLFLIHFVVGQISCRGTVCKQLYANVEKQIILANQQYEALEEKGRQLMMQYEQERSDIDLVRNQGVRRAIEEKTRALREAYRAIPRQKNLILKGVLNILKPLAPPLQAQLLRKHGLYYRFAPEYNAAPPAYVI
ncbi:Uncharacterized protein QTN25_001630 [Entamoeba marina]